jgi:peptidoglycan/LPS O-acetylase OafA/YrhL
VSEPGSRQSEIDGLRALAIIAVVLFHTRVPGFEGGFTGVDVFFVISGFLITRLLVNEHERTGTISLPAFWSRRFRRILPSLLLTIAVTAIVGYSLQAPWEWRELMHSARAAAASVSNFFFWGLSGGYFANRAVNQPLLHTWSLGVEEQFYLVWPVTVLATLKLGGRKALGLWISIAAVASFVVSLMLTKGSPSAAFYLPQSRMWELATGAMVLLVRHAPRVPAAVRAVAGWAGLAAIVASAVFVSAENAFPAPRALAPVLATAALILALVAPAPRGVQVVLAWRPLVLIGLWSYSWYLFHWPAIVFTRVVVGEHRLWLELVMCLAVLGLAAANWRFLETHFTHRSPMRDWAHRHTLAVGLSASLLVVGVTTVVARTAGDVPLERPAAEVLASIVTAPTDTGGPATTPDTAAGNFDWHSALGLHLLAESRTNVDWPCINFIFHDPFNPACVAIPGDRYLLVIGDSHASGIGMAAAPVAKEHDLGLIVVGQPQCPVVGTEVWVDGSLYGGCGAWARDVQSQLVAHHAELAAVIWTARSDYYFPGDSIAQSVNAGEAVVGTADHPVNALADAAAIWRDGIHSLATALSTAGVPLVLVHSSPELHGWPSDCLAAGTPGSCAARRSELDPYRAPSLAAETAALADVPLTAAIDPYTILCDATLCPVVRGRDVLYRDDNHFTPAGARALTPALRAAIDRLLAGA